MKTEKIYCYAITMSREDEKVCFSLCPDHWYKEIFPFYRDQGFVPTEVCQIAGTCDLCEKTTSISVTLYNKIPEGSTLWIRKKWSNHNSDSHLVKREIEDGFYTFCGLSITGLFTSGEIKSGNIVECQVCARRARSEGLPINFHNGQNDIWFWEKYSTEGFLKYCVWKRRGIDKRLGP